jgi:uncharacterized membrane protein
LYTYLCYRSNYEITICERTAGMSNLVIGIFRDEEHAEEVRRHMLTEEVLQSREVEDAVVVKKTLAGKVKFRHMPRETATGAVVGAFWGAMIGLLSLNPVFLLGGLVIGLFVGGVYGAFSHIGLDADFVKTEAESMNPGNSAVCVLTRDGADRVMEEMGKFDGNVIQTRLCTHNADVKYCRERSHPV